MMLIATLSIAHPTVRQRRVAETSQRPSGGPAAAAAARLIHAGRPLVLRASDDRQRSDNARQHRPKHIQADSHLNRSAPERQPGHHQKAAAELRSVHRVCGRHSVGIAVETAIQRIVAGATDHASSAKSSADAASG